MKLFSNHFVRMAFGLSLTLLVAGRASAQYGGGTGGGTTGGAGGSSGGTYTAPKGGYSSTGKAVGIGVGAAAGVGILAYALHHHHAQMTACVEPTDDGLRIVDEKKNASYALKASDVYLKAGQRVEVQGKKSKSDAGVETFVPTKLVKDLGPCGGPATPSTTAQTQPSGH